MEYISLKKTIFLPLSKRYMEGTQNKMVPLDTNFQYVLSEYSMHCISEHCPQYACEFHISGLVQLTSSNKRVLGLSGHSPENDCLYNVNLLRKMFFLFVYPSLLKSTQRSKLSYYLLHL